MAPAARPAVYLGKLLGIVALLVGVEAVLVPLVALLFEARAMLASCLARRDPRRRNNRVRLGRHALRGHAHSRADA